MVGYVFGHLFLLALVFQHAFQNETMCNYILLGHTVSFEALKHKNMFVFEISGI